MSWIFWPGTVVVSILAILLIIGTMYIIRKVKQVQRRLNNLEQSVYKREVNPSKQGRANGE